MAVQMLDKTLVMKQKRSSMIQVQKELDFGKIDDSDSENIYQEPRQDRFDEIIDLLKTQSIYGEDKNITLGVVDVPIEKQIAIDKASTKGLKSETYENNSENKLDKLRKLRRGN